MFEDLGICPIVTILNFDDRVRASHGENTLLPEGVTEGEEKRPCKGLRVVSNESWNHYIKSKTTAEGYVFANALSEAQG